MGNVISVKDGRRFLPIHELCFSLSEITCRVLPAAHALSGCDPGLKKRSQFPDFQMNRQCNTDFQLALMGYFD
jgi:hypothetical protein